MYKKNTVLIDFNNLCFRTMFSKDVDIYGMQNFSIWRFFVFDSIYRAIWLDKNINEVVIAVDNKNSWRKSYFSRYKERRKKQRDKKLDWNLIFGEMNNLSKEFKHYMPFKVLHIMSAEADDIIAIIALHTDNNCIVVSNDEDYLQLCSKRVKVYNPSKKKFITCSNPEKFVIGKCLTGQAKDDIFNVITPDNWGKTKLTEGKKKPGFGKVALKDVETIGYKKWLREKKTYTKLDVEVNPEKNFHRNRILMDFKKIPKTIIDRTLEQYYNQTYPPPDNIYQFFKKHNMREFLEKYHSVENKLLRMY